MNKLQAFTMFLMEATGLPRENFSSWADQGDLIASGRHLGTVFDAEGNELEQVEIGLWLYDCVIQIERYPGSGPELAAMIMGWLETNDPDRGDLPMPQLDVSLNDFDSSDCDIACQFEERLSVREDANGPIHFRGKRWSLCPVVITPAEEFTLQGQIRRPVY